jgi:hypothetical protein
MLDDTEGLALLVSAGPNAETENKRLMTMVGRLRFILRANYLKPWIGA